MDSTDDELIAQYREGSEEAFAALMERYLKPIYGFSRRMAGAADAEDVVQETFVKVWRTLPRYKMTNTFRSWIFAIARNTAIDRLRKKKSAVFSDFEDATGRNSLLESLSDPELLPATLIERAEQKGLVERALAEIEPEDREILHLHYSEEMTFDAIGEIVKKPPNTVKSRHRRALMRMREFLEKQG